MKSLPSGRKKNRQLAHTGWTGGRGESFAGRNNPVRPPRRRCLVHARAVNHGLGMLDEATRCYEKTLILNPIHPEAHFYVGNIRGEREDTRGDPVLPQGAATETSVCGRGPQSWSNPPESPADSRSDRLLRAVPGAGSGSADVYFNLGTRWSKSAGTKEPYPAIARRWRRILAARTSTSIWALPSTRG